MNIALFGGKFDPPHLGHLNVALQVLDKVPTLDQLWLIPAKTHQWRKIYASGNARKAMLKTFTRYDKRLVVCDVELKRNRSTATIDTIIQLKNQYPQNYFYWVMGSDNVATFHLWNQYKRLQRLIRFLIYPRPKFPIKTLPKNFSAIPKFKLKITKYSSSSIRKLISQGKSVSRLLTPEVRKYIQKNHLYC